MAESLFQTVENAIPDDCSDMITYIIELITKASIHGRSRILSRRDPVPDSRGILYWMGSCATNETRR